MTFYIPYGFLGSLETHPVSHHSYDLQPHEFPSTSDMDVLPNPAWKKVPSQSMIQIPEQNLSGLKMSWGWSNQPVGSFLVHSICLVPLKAGRVI